MKAFLYVGFLLAAGLLAACTATVTTYDGSGHMLGQCTATAFLTWAGGLCDGSANPSKQWSAAYPPRDQGGSAKPLPGETPPRLSKEVEEYLKGGTSPTPSAGTTTATELPRVQVKDGNLELAPPATK
jgi:hypothetical protein